MYLSAFLDLIEMVYVYQDPTYDEAILSEINTSLVQLKELCIAQINTQGCDNEQFPARRTFFYRKQCSVIRAVFLSELQGIGPKRNKVTLVETTQNGTRSVIIPLS